MTDNDTVDLIRLVALRALPAAPTLLKEWLPEGRPNGREWVARNDVRGDRQAGSFGVSLDSGRWNDFADDQAHGGDLVSLLAYLRQCRQVEAAREIDQRLALGLFESSGAPSAPSAQQAEALKAARTKAEENRRRSDAVQQEKQQAATRQAVQLWQRSKPADRLHPYLVAKGVSPLKLRQMSQGKLLVPLCLDGRLVNLQVIDCAGAKRFLSGGRVLGCYSPLGRVIEGSRLYVCEGWATGATLHIHTGQPVVCAMNAGNLRAVALAMRALHGQSVELVIAGDDDRQTRGNPGRTSANRAAFDAGALVVFPEWPQQAPPELSDFNDLHLWRNQLWEAKP
ncbi:toprim domain-containing protein [Pseudomonas sp. Xaverov 83]|uniref:toprim domain-containing protein n=1 Tax=Pseudomonas sp. Xaverov 83 TaxID=2666087 RepID=UPI001C5A706B|nr:toprim domain-containing protein [Pseudomonas sp. Xaverov 83]